MPLSRALDRRLVERSNAAGRGVRSIEGNSSRLAGMKTSA